MLQQNQGKNVQKNGPKLTRKASLDSVEAKLKAIEKSDNDFDIHFGSSFSPDSNSLINTSERIKRKVLKSKGKDIREALD